MRAKPAERAAVAHVVFGAPIPERFFRDTYFALVRDRVHPYFVIGARPLQLYNFIFVAALLSCAFGPQCVAGARGFKVAIDGGLRIEVGATFHTLFALACEI